MRYARAARRYILTTTVTGILTAALIVAQAWLIAHAISPVVDGTASFQDVTGLLWALLAVFLARGTVMLIQELLAHRAATETIVQLRKQIMDKSLRLGPRWQSEHGADTVTLATRGLDDLEPYFTRYLPQLLLASTVTPATVVVMLTQDLVSSLIVIFTIPLIPIFMILIGRLTARYSAERLESMERLGGQVLDLLAGLPTLKALGRENGPGRRVRALGEAYTATTMSTLRVAFISGAALEFITTLSVALVAVEIGLFRLLPGNLSLTTGLLVIMIAPEVYQPLRQVGFHFHASANGVAAAEAAFQILEAEEAPAGTLPAPDLRETEIVIEQLGVRARGNWAPHNLNATITPGSLVALAGLSGAGKTTTSQVLLKLLPADQGQIRLRSGSHDLLLADVAADSWWEQVTWVPQRPVFLPGTVRSNLLGDDVDATSPIPAELTAAAQKTGFDEVLATLPNGWDTQLGQGGVGLSVGQRQRLALTRALVEQRQLVVLDEPTAHLDAASEQHVLDAVQALREQGRTVVVIAHRHSLIDLADTVIQVHASELDEQMEVAR